MSIIRSNSQAASTSSTGGSPVLSSISEMNSLRFDGASYLSRIPTTAGNRRIYTYSVWVKKSIENFALFGAENGSAQVDALTFTSAKLLHQRYYGTQSVNAVQETNSVLRDFSAWYHIVFVFDVAQSTVADKTVFYVNGERQEISTAGSLGETKVLDFWVNSTATHRIGYYYATANNAMYPEGYMANIHFIDGQALDANAFGEEISETWVPKEYSGSYGNNGFHLDFAASNMDWTNSKVLDASGNGNDWNIN